MKDKKSLFRWILLAVGVLLVAYGSIRLGRYLSEMNLVRNTTAELREAAATAAVTTAPAVTDEPAGTPEPLPEKAVPAPAENSVPEEEPAVSATLPDVEYPNGYTRLLTRPYTIMLYGHNMKSGMMFGNLRKYEDPVYCRKHRTLRFDTLYEEGQYEIFAVVTISVTPGKARYLDLWALRSSDRETRKNALASLKRANSYVSTAEVSEEDQILLLITCVGDDDERLVVAAVRMKD